MISEEKLRKELQSLWKRHPPVAPSSFAEADRLIEEVVEAATVSRVKAARKKLTKGKV